jgi:hypothetical protein
MGWKENRENKLKYRRENRLCLRCGVHLKEDNNKVNCKNCRDRQYGWVKKRIKIKERKGQCIRCSSTPMPGKTYCISCFNKIRKQSKDRENRLLENNLCKNCGKYDVIGESKKCGQCYFQQASYLHTRNKNRWKEFKNLLEAQNFICPISGRKLIPGKNASVDHILPKSKFPSLSKDTMNMRWVDVNINHMKNNLTDDEFNEILEEIFIFRKRK